MPDKRSNVLQGAYVSLDQLLSLRFRRGPRLLTRSNTMTGNQAGLRLSKHNGRGVDFAEVRQYQPGDDIRSIDWRVTARKNSPHTKVFREERERPALIFVDQSQHMFFGSIQRLKSVAAAELAARIAWQITSSGDRVGGMVLDREGHHMFRPFRTVKATGQLLAQIARSNLLLTRQTIESADSMISQNRLSNALTSLEMLRQQRNRVFVISDFAGPLELWIDTLRQLARRHQVRILQIYDPLDKQLPPTGVYNISHGKRNISFFSGDAKLRAQFSQAYEQRKAVLQDLCRHPALSFRALSTADTDWDQLLWD